MAWCLTKETRENLKKEKTPFCNSHPFSCLVKIVLPKGTPISAAL
jgi:hypothetical protein